MRYVKTIIIPLLSLMMTISISNNAFSVSATVKSQEDYIYSLDVLRSINIMIENFNEEQLQKRHEQINKLFREAGEDFYGRNFNTSMQKFRKLKFELIDLLEIMSKKYLDRTKEILDSTQKESFEVLIKYSSKNSSFITYFRKAFDPLNDIKPYDPTKFHYFYSRQRIETYLRNGYKNYQEALNQFNDPDNAVLRKKKNLMPVGQNYLINRYLNIIYLCREGKQLGIEIHRILNSSELLRSLKEFGVTGRSMDPIFDYRIPDQYKVDANDNLGLIHSIELQRMTKRKQ